MSLGYSWEYECSSTCPQADKRVCLGTCHILGKSADPVSVEELWVVATAFLSLWFCGALLLDTIWK